MICHYNFYNVIIENSFLLFFNNFLELHEFELKIELK